jgi:hypothetical protein
LCGLFGWTRKQTNKQEANAEATTTSASLPGFDRQSMRPRRVTSDVLFTASHHGPPRQVFSPVGTMERVRRFLLVIASGSEAIQLACTGSGLLRRVAPRNDEDQI